MLCDLGRREEAVAALQDAVDIYRRPAQKPTRRLPPPSRNEPRRARPRFGDLGLPNK
jgi:hypothetical protein